MKKHLFFLLIVVVLVSLVVGTAFTKNKNKSGQGWLGITTQSVDYDLAEAFELGVKYGALINSIYDDSPAEEAKLLEEDVIISLNGEKVTDVDDLLDLLEETKPGDNVKLIIVREGEKKNITVTIDERPKSFNKYAIKNKIKNKIKHGIFYSDDDDNDVKTFNFGDKAHGYLGVHLVDLSEQLGDYFGVSDGEGVLISSVEEDSPAEKAGIKAGDVVLSADSEKIEDSGDLSDAVLGHDEGDKIKLVVLRDGHRKEITCEVGETDSYSWFHNPGDVDIFIPKTPHFPKHGYSYHSDFDFDDIDFDFDEEEFEKGMQEFHEAMKELKHLKGLKFDIKHDFQNEFEEKMEELKQELKQLKKELDKINEKLE